MRGALHGLGRLRPRALGGDGESLGEQALKIRQGDPSDVQR